MLLLEQAKIGIKKNLEDRGQVDQLSYPILIRCVKNIRYTKIIFSKISIGRKSQVAYHLRTFVEYSHYDLIIKCQICTI